MVRDKLGPRAYLVVKVKPFSAPASPVAVWPQGGDRQMTAHLQVRMGFLLLVHSIGFCSSAKSFIGSKKLHPLKLLPVSVG